MGHVPNLKRIQETLDKDAHAFKSKDSFPSAPNPHNITKRSDGWLTLFYIFFLLI